MNTKFDVIIVGFGPAGSTASNLLSRKGFRVLALEKCVFPRKKICGGGLTPKTIKLLDELAIISTKQIKSDTLNIKLIKGVKVTTEELEYSGDFPNGFGACVNRRYFDNLLAKKALENNVTLIENAQAIEPIFEKGAVCGVKYKTKEGIKEEKAKIVLISDGAASPLSRILSGYSTKHQIKAVNTFCAPSQKETSDYFEFYFSKKLIPGYFWVFPFNDAEKGPLYSAGFGVEKKMDLKKEYLQMHKKYLDGRASAGEPETWIIPVDYPKKNFGDGWLLLGDAAGLANPVTGEGIFYAIKSGEFAALSVEEAFIKGSFKRETLKTYTNLIDDRFKKEYNLCNTIKKLLPLGFHKQFFRAAINKRGALENFMAGEMDFNGITLKKILKYLFVILLLAAFLQGCASGPGVLPVKNGFFPTADAYLHFSKGLVFSDNWMYPEALEEYKKALALDPDSEYLSQVLAREYERIGKHEEASLLYQKLVRISTNSKTLLSSAAFFIEQERFIEAEAICKQITVKDENDPDASFLLGNIYYKQNQTDKAIEMFSKVTELDPGAETAYFNLGLAYGKKGDFVGAENNYRKAYEVNPDYTSPIYALGLLFQIQGKPEKAVEEYNKLLAKSQFDSRVFKNLGLAYVQMKKYTEAIDALKKSVELDSNDTETLYRLALLLFQDKKYKDALTYAESLVKIVPDYADGWQILGSNQTELGLMNEAVTSYEKFVELDPENPAAYIYLSYLYTKQQEFAKMTVLLEKGAVNMPENTDIKLYLGGAYFESKNYAKSEAAYRDVLKLKNNDERATYSLGVLLERTGRFEEAVSTFKQVIALNPGNADAYNYAGYICADQNINLEEALLLIKEALKLQPDNWAYVDSLGWVYFRLGKLDEAEKEIKRAAALMKKQGSEDATIYEHLGDIFLKRNLNSEAIKMYEKSLKLADNGTVRRKLDEVKTKK